MDVEVIPGSAIAGETQVPGDKSIAHRWLILAATAVGRSRIAGAPPSLDVRSTARCLASLVPKARPSLDVFASKDSAPVEGGGSTWNVEPQGEGASALEVEGEGRSGLAEPAVSLDCGNSGTTMRLLTGVVAASPFEAVLTGDASLSRRPMERVARPLRSMGARVDTRDGHAPVRVRGGALRGIEFSPDLPSAQVKSAVLLAGIASDGETIVREPAPTRDHTERALAALGGPIEITEGAIRVVAFQHDGFDGVVPGDPSSAAFLIAAAALTHSSLTIRDVGLNPSRLRFVDVMERMGVPIRRVVDHTDVGEPVGTIEVGACDGIEPVQVEPDEVPLVIDEIPVLAALAAHAPGDSRFLDAGELRVKESDRMRAVVETISGLGGKAAAEGNDLVLAGGGLAGGAVDAAGDHRMAMAACVAALGARGSSRIAGMDAADVSFPGFVHTLRALGARLEDA